MALFQFKQQLECYRVRCEAAESIGDVLRELVEETGYETYLYEQSETPVQAQKRMQHIWELIAWIERLFAQKELSGLAEVVNRLMLIDRLEQTNAEQLPAVQLMTLHASKGLEFAYVYLVGLEEGLLPHHASIEEEFIAEERRLLYVGITRAQKALCFSLSTRRRRAREWVDCVPSRFLQELPADSLVWYGQREKRDEAVSQLTALNHLASLRHILGSVDGGLVDRVVVDG
jgi:ATP-dependent DNA helicase Rep